MSERVKKLRWAAIATTAVLFPLVMTEYPGGHADLWPIRATFAVILATAWLLTLIWTVRRLRESARRYLFRYAWRHYALTPRLPGPILAVPLVLLAGVLPVPAATACAIAALGLLVVDRLIGILLR